MRSAYQARAAATAAPASTTAVMEVTSATAPATSTPTGTVPPNAIIHSAITRPLTASSRWDCRIVDSEVTTEK